MIDGWARTWPVLVIGAFSCAVYGLGFDVAPERPATQIFGILYYPLFAGYLAAAWWIWRRRGVSPALVITLAIVFRLLAVSDPPALSSDVYRYPWDGRVQRAGISPYRHPPADEALAHLRDTVIHPQINRQSARTVYPPGAQAVFAVLPYSVDGVRWIMIALDVLTMLLLASLLARCAIDPARVVLYAWAPLVVYEIGNGGHLEAAVLPLLVGAALAMRSARGRLAGALIGAAAAIKLYPILAVAALAKRRPSEVLVPAALVVAAGYLVYGVWAGPDVIGFLPSYVGSAEDHNIGLRALLEWALSPLVAQPRTAAFMICLATFGTGAVVLWRRREAPVEQRLLGFIGLYLLTLPTAFHPWYALWIVPWLCIHPRASWLWLTGALPLSYLKYGSPGGVMPGWVVPVELIPTGMLLAWEARRR